VGRCMGCLILIKIINYRIRQTDLLSLINSLLAYVYCSTTLLNYGLIRFKNSSRKIVSICAFSFINNLYLILYAYV
jgi:hypothetical protein